VRNSEARNRAAQNWEPAHRAKSGSGVVGFSVARVAGRRAGGRERYLVRRLQRVLVR